MKYFLLSIILLLFVLPTSVATSFLDIFNEKYIYNISDLPKSTNLHPNIIWNHDANWIDKFCTRSQTNCVIGWIDIVGFRNLTRRDNIWYLNAPPEKEIIIQYGAFAVPGGGRYLGRCCEYELTMYHSNGQMIAELKITAVFWKQYSDGYIEYDNQTIFINDAELLPQPYPPLNSNLQFNMSIRNNSYYDIIRMAIPTEFRENLNFQDKNDSIQKINYIARVNQTLKGIYFADIFDVSEWQINGVDLTHSGNAIVIPNATNVNVSKDLQIQISNIYLTKTINLQINNTDLTSPNITISKTINHPESNLFNLLIYGLFGIVGLILLASRFLLKRMMK